MGKSLKDSINEVRGCIFGKKTFSHHEFVSLIHRAGYSTKINGNSHVEVYKSDGTRLTGDNGLPIIFSKKGDVFPGHYRKILKFVLDDLESRYEI